MIANARASQNRTTRPEWVVRRCFSAVVAILMFAPAALFVGCGGKTTVPAGQPSAVEKSQAPAPAPAPAAPAPVAKKRAEIPPPPPVNLAEFFCMNTITPFHQRVSDDPAIREGVWNDLRAKAAKAADLGATSLRCDMWWGVMEPKQGQSDVAFHKQVIDEVVAAGFDAYPILCYNAAWSPDQSPNTPEYREQFGRYVRELVGAAKGKVTWWEVWNEPNITPFWVPNPNAEDYTELLKVAYREAKAADPNCKIVAMCTAGADYKFIEESYRLGAAAAMDALSYHHYSDTRDEAVLEGEIREIRRIMARYGDSAKPLFITELGVSSGASDIMKAFTEEDQASWIVKKHLVSVAEGANRLYYFKMPDEDPRMKSDGVWGLVTWELEMKPSGVAYKAMTERLKDARFAGRAYRASINDDRHDDVELLLFEKGGEVLAVAWARKEGKPITVRLLAEEEVQIENLSGEQTAEVSPEKIGAVAVTLTHEPVYVRGLSKRALGLTAVRFDPAPLCLSPGETRDVAVIVDNPTDRPLEVSLQGMLDPPLRSGLTIKSSDGMILCPAGKTARGTLTVSLAADIKPFSSMRYVDRDQPDVSFALSIYYQKPFDIGFLMESEDDHYTFDTSFRNMMDETASGGVSWFVNDRPSGETRAFRDLRPGASASIQKKIGPSRRSAVMRAEVRTERGVVGSKEFQAWGQPLLIQAPNLDGELGEWVHRSSVRLSPAKYQLRPDKSSPLSEAQLAATVYVGWTADTLYIAADVTDATPLVNPHEGTELWRGDSMEFYIGFDGPTRDPNYGPNHYQIGVKPAAEAGQSVVWNWRSKKPGAKGGAPIEGAKVVVVKKQTGYCFEAAIPLSEFGMRVNPGRLIGFDMALDNKNDPKAENNEGVLMWNGDGTGWRDPSVWGTAVILAE